MKGFASSSKGSSNEKQLHAALGYLPPAEFERNQRMPLRGSYLDEFSEGLGNLSIRWRRQPCGRRPLIVWMSFRLPIPWRVALPQSLPPLLQPGISMLCYRLAGREVFIERQTVS